jgi:hypothetical protein
VVVDELAADEDTEAAEREHLHVGWFGSAE